MFEIKKRHKGETLTNFFFTTPFLFSYQLPLSVIYVFNIFTYNSFYSGVKFLNLLKINLEKENIISWK